MKAKLDLRLAQKLIVTPQLQQAIKLLQLSRLELNQVISQELSENPLLEDSTLELSEDENVTSPEQSPSDNDSSGEEKGEEEESLDSQSFKWEEYFGDDYEENKSAASMSESIPDLPTHEQTLTKSASLSDHLLWQLRLSAITSEEKKVGEHIIGNIDEDGYLRIPLEEIAEACHAALADVEKVLRHIQTFDPPGVAARDLKECLLLQVHQLGLGKTLVAAIVDRHLEDLERKRYQVISKAEGASSEAVLRAVKVIESLEPKPGRPYSTTENFAIIPDVFVAKSGKDYVVVLNEEGMPRLSFSPYYKQLLRAKDNVPQATRNYLEERLRSAIWFIKSIEQRSKTICRVAESIVKFQRDFFEKGMPYLKPLVLREIAEDISMHESTISRVTANKYMHTPEGLFKLKFFFTNGLSPVDGQGDGYSSKSVRDLIKKLVSEEDPHQPLKDQEILQTLKDKNVVIARRTIAKYRSELAIPPANKRKKFW